MSGEEGERPREEGLITCVAPPGAVAQPCSKHCSPGLLGLAPASHSCNLRACVCVRARARVSVSRSLARPVCKRARVGDGGREGKKRREAIKHTHLHTPARSPPPQPPEFSGLQLFHVGQQCWQGRRPGAAGSRSPACARGWRLAGAPLPAGAIVGLVGAERRTRTCSFLGASIRLVKRWNQRRSASPPRRPRPRYPGGGSLQSR